jgi:hypothetical protein
MRRDALLPALMACTAVACSVGDYRPGIEVTFQLQTSGARPPAAATSGGVTRLERGFLTTVSLGLESCDATARAAGRGLGALLMGTAHAHTPTTPTMLGVPIVQDLRAGGQSSPGVIRPPPGRYCAVRWAVGPADDDALGLAAAPDMAGLTARLEGTFEGASGVGQAFSASTRARASGSIPIEPWDLGPPRETPWTIRVSHQLPSLLEGLDQAVGAEAAAGKLLDNRAAALTVEVL